MGNAKSKNKNGAVAEAEVEVAEVISEPNSDTTNRRRGGAKPGVPRPPVRPLEERLALKQKSIDFHEDKIATLKAEMKAMGERATGKTTGRTVNVEKLDNDTLAALEARIAEEKAKRSIAPQVTKWAENAADAESAAAKAAAAWAAAPGATEGDTEDLSF